MVRGISNFLHIDVDDLFSFGERISLSIILSMLERSGIKFKVTSRLGSLPQVYLGQRCILLVTDIKESSGLISRMFTNCWSITHY